MYIEIIIIKIKDKGKQHGPKSKKKKKKLLATPFHTSIHQSVTACPIIRY